MIQAESPQPTRTSSTLTLLRPDFDGVPLAAFVGDSSTISKLSLSIHSARAFHTLAMSSHPGRAGLSMWLIVFHSVPDSLVSSFNCDLLILMPCSLTQRTYFPERDHLTVLMMPSPLCRTLSVPVLAPSPSEPNQPEAAAAVPVVVAFALFPACPPVVNTKLPAWPPDK